MPKNLYCAECGMELLMLRKVVQKQIINCIESHECAKEMILPGGLTEVTSKEAPIDIESEFDKFKFVKKLNGLASKPTKDIQDKRASEHVREVPKSSAPVNILDKVKELTNTVPENPVIDPKED